MNRNSDRQRGRPPRRALARVEVICILFALIIIGSLVYLLPTVRQHLANQRILQDQSQLLTIHQALLDESAAYGDAAFATPTRFAGKHDTDKRGFYAAVELNTTANLYSSLVAHNLLDTETLVSPAEPNDAVSVLKDYDFSAYDPANDSWWDSRFKADLVDGSHASYAHTPLFGDRRTRHWRDDGSNHFVTLSNRGVIDGNDQVLSVYQASNTLAMHGPPDMWHGNIVLNDHSVELLNTFNNSELQYRFR